MIAPAIPTTKKIATQFTLERDAFGKLVLTSPLGERFDGVVPVRAFPFKRQRMVFPS